MKIPVVRLLSLVAALTVTLGANAATGSVVAKRATQDALTAKVKGQKELTDDHGFAMFRTRHSGSSAQRFTQISHNKLNLSRLMQQSIGVPQSDGSVPTLNAACIYRSTWTNSSPEFGIYSIATDGTSIVPVAQSNNFDVQAGYYADGKYYTVQMNSYGSAYFITNKVFDATTWEIISTNNYGGDITTYASDFAYDETTGNAYGCFYNSSLTGYVLGIYDPETISTTEIAPITDPWNACAVASDGYIYAVTFSGNLMKVDKTTGESTSVGTTGLAPYYQASAAFDRTTGRYFYLYCGATESALYEIDLNTAAATRLFTFDNTDEYVGAWFAQPATDNAAPGKIENFAADFANGSLSGTVTFTAPTMSYDGSPLAGSLTYTVTVDGMVAATGSTESGATVSVPITVAASGNRVVAAYVSNSSGDGPSESVTLFVGVDHLKPVANLTLTYTDGIMSLSWDAATTTENGGYYDASAVRYTVTRYPDAAVVAEKQEETTFTEPYTSQSLKNVYYTVEVSAGDDYSAIATSNAIAIGTATLPYFNGFDDESSLAGLTQINCNNDGNSWELSKGELRFMYSETAAMDAWLIAPAITFEAGKTYKVSIDARVYIDKYSERVEVRAGTSPTAEAMTISLIPKTDLTTAIPSTLSTYFVPEESGIYYIGVHGCSDADMFYLYIDNLFIDEGFSLTAPEAATNLAASTDSEGANKATVSFKAPEKTVSGERLTELEKIEVKRDGKLVKTFATPAPGAELEFVDDVETSGDCTYSVQAYNASGAGFVAKVTVFVGVDVPAAPTNARFTESTETPGLVTITWNAPATDIHGTKIDPATVTYTIVSSDNTILADRIAATSLTKQFNLDGQTFVYYAVIASNDRGYNQEEYAYTELAPIGAPYTVPFSEPFGDNFVSAWGMNLLEGSEITWSVIHDNSGIPAQNGDNVAVVCYGKNEGVSRLMSGKIHLGDLETPAFKFWYVTFDDSMNTFDVLAREVGGEWITLKKFSTMGEEMKWNLGLVDLSGFKGKTIQIAIKVTVVNLDYTIFDNFFVGTPADNDLAVESISATSRVKPGEQVKIGVTLVNNGLKTASGYAVKLYRDGEQVQEMANGAEIAAGAKTAVTFTETASHLWSDEVSYRAEVVLADDAVADNNTSEEATVAIVHANVPAASGLEARYEEGIGTTLTWNVPETAVSGSREITESFEGFEAFAVNPSGEWTFVDADGKATYPISGISFPGSGSAMAYIVLDATYEGFNGTFAAHSGNKYMASFSVPSSQNDDWLISPALSGEAQRVSFYAKSYVTDYGCEEFEVLYSTAGTVPADFISLGEVHDTPAQWTEYGYELPEGAKHFAIRCISADRFIFCIDDVTYSVAAEAPLLLGYNIYRDGEKINDSPVAATTYVDALVPEGEHRYVVTAVYDQGESRPSNEVSVSVSGVEPVEGCCAAIVATGKNRIVVTNAVNMAVTVVAADGRVVYAGKGHESLVIPVAEGVYAVKVGNKAVKTIVQ